MPCPWLSRKSSYPLSFGQNLAAIQRGPLQAHGTGGMAAVTRELRGRAGARQPLAQRGSDLRRLVEGGKMAALVDHRERGAGNGAGHFLVHLGRRDLIVAAAEHERRAFDLA